MLKEGQRRCLEVEVGGVWCLPRIKTTHESGAQERGRDKAGGSRRGRACSHLHEDSQVVFVDAVSSLSRVCSPPDSPVHGILQARTLEWVVIPFSKGSSRPWDGTCISCTCRRVLYHLSILRAGGGLHNIWGRKWMLEEERLMQERKCKNFPESGEWAGPEQQPRGEHGGFVMAICSWIQA